ncbi:cyclic nucleotide-binding domain-containing protein [Xylophilus rhododendri]|uniref:Cyclic nucleotide-binding domain-containing protein n=1 Tax=Xylophilus rhododendri TaxID=2697032 RepID=A0A857J6G6_9BURK|nr:cyclic nucleotide-binding domain-containing protein [Xylophilus rhododendri]QHI98388.1 cyclic nucleotide-binding domain-containing protein [Xylophilus rhododendri]
MKGILGLLGRNPVPPTPAGEATDSVFFSTAFADQGVDATLLVPWDARAVEIGARRLAAGRGIKLMQHLWARDKHMCSLEPERIALLERFFHFATVPAGREIIRQDEYGNFMLVLLEGGISVDRRQPWGERLRLAETRPGDILGEMSLLDSGLRFSACTTLTDCDVAVLSAEAMDEMMDAEPHTACHLVALLARKLSLRLRMVSASLGENK